MTGRRDRGWLAAVAIACAIVGCDVTPPPPGDDAAVVDDAGTPGIPGFVELLPASTEGPGVPVDRLELRIASVRMVSDRGAEYDPVVDDVGFVSVGDTELEIPVGDVPPALYSAVILELEDDAGDPVFETVLTLAGGPTLDISTTQPLTLDARCEHGAVVSTTGAVSIGVDLAIGEPIQRVLLFALPAPDASGVVHVNETTAPDAIAEFRHELAEHVHSECGPDTF